jgi:hypothetical protein
MQTIVTTHTWYGFAAGTRVSTLIETRGATSDDSEIVHPIGAYGTIDAVVYFGSYQGYGVHVTIADGDQAICNSFDDLDIKAMGRIPFQPA